MDDLLPPHEWRLGRIEKTYFGSDGNVRIAEVRTANGIVTRPIVKLCYLPIDSQGLPETQNLMNLLRKIILIISKPISSFITLYLYHYRSQKSNRSSVYRCGLCTRYHSIRFCSKFLMMTPAERNRAVRRHDYCINCLARSHTFRECRSKNTCQKCQHYHHTLLHPSDRPRVVPPSHAIQRTSPCRLSQRTSPSRHSQRTPPSHQIQRAPPKLSQKRLSKEKQQPPATTVPDQQILSEAIKSLAIMLCASTQTRRHV